MKCDYTGSSFFLDELKTPKCHLRLKAETRFVEGLDKMRLRQVNQRLGFTARKNLDLDIGYNFQGTRANSNLRWFHNHLIDLELNPRISLKNGISVTFRNRYEARWMETLGTTNFDRFRHRTTLAIPVNGPLGLNRIKLSNDFFYSFIEDSYNQN